jgi:hypothetical protein
MEKIMNNTSNLDHAKLEDCVLADSELDAVTGGMLTFCNSDFDDILTTASGANGHVK